MYLAGCAVVGVELLGGEVVAPDPPPELEAFTVWREVIAWGCPYMFVTLEALGLG